MNWEQFAREVPDLARAGEERFARTGVILLGSVRRDGSPRVSPVEPLLTGSDLYLGMMWQSKKALDLLREPRCVVHSTVCDREATDGEFKLRGQAIEVQDPEVRERYCRALYEKIAWRPEEPYHLFAIDIESATLITWDKSGRMTAAHWRPGKGIRRSDRES